MSRSFAIFVLVATTGCADIRAVRHAPALPPPREADTTRYRLACSDVVAISFAEKPSWNCIASVDVDGCVVIVGDVTTRVPVQGNTAEEAQQQLERELACPRGSVTVTLLEARAAKLFVTGPDNRRIRAYAYSGPTRALDFLQQVGAIVPNESKLNDVYVLRPNVTVDESPQIYHVDVEAVAFEGNQTTNIEVRPSDHIFVGETRRASFSRLLPAWLRPTYRRVLGLLPSWE